MLDGKFGKKWRPAKTRLSLVLEEAVCLAAYTIPHAVSAVAAVERQARHLLEARPQRWAKFRKGRGKRDGFGAQGALVLAHLHSAVRASSKVSDRPRL